MSVLAMLIYQPLDLYNAGFQLSFGTVLGLMLFTKPMLAFFTPDDADARVLAALHQHVGQAEYASCWLDRWA